MPWKEEAAEDDTIVNLMYSYGDEKTTPPVSGWSSSARSHKLCLLCPLSFSQCRIGLAFRGLLMRSVFVLQVVCEFDWTMDEPDVS